MPFLLRVSLPDVPGSLGRLASAIGEAGGDIDAIEIVEKRDGIAVDDVFLEMVDGAMPDAVVSACTEIDGVEVLWISRYAAGGNVFLDLEAVEDLTEHPGDAPDRLVDLLPTVFQSEWGARVHRARGVLRATGAAPGHVEWVDVSGPELVPGHDEDLLVACPLGPDEILLIGRRGGPVFLASELARFQHLANLARTIAG